MPQSLHTSPLIDAHQRELAHTVLGTASGMASVLLVFVAFVYGKSETINSVPRARKYQHVARAGCGPFVVALLASWLALSCLQTGDLATFQAAVFGLQTSIVLTGLFALVVMFVYL